MSAARKAALWPCDACLGDSPDPSIAARERIAVSEPPFGSCCAWSRAEVADGVYDSRHAARAFRRARGEEG